jgi:hypothetical protein
MKITEDNYKQIQADLIKFKNKKEDEELKILGKWIEDNIGKTFVYRNNSSGGDSPKWDVFKIIVGKKNNYTAIVQEWKLINSREKQFSIEQKEDNLYIWSKDEDTLGGCPRCTLKEFESNKKKILRLLTKGAGS